MNQEIQTFVDSISTVSDTVSRNTGAAIGLGTGYVEVANGYDLMPTYVYPDWLVFTMDIGLVFMYGAVGALGAALINWMLKRFFKKKDD